MHMYVIDNNKITTLEKIKLTSWIYQKKRLLTRRETPCLSYKTLNLCTNWFVSLQPLVIIPKYVIRPKSLHC